MAKQQLAQELRQRQYDAGLVQRYLIDALSDDQIIDSYLTCSHCGKRLVTQQEEAQALRQATNAGQFLDLCDEFAQARPHRD